MGAFTILWFSLRISELVATFKPSGKMKILEAMDKSPSSPKLDDDPQKTTVRGRPEEPRPARNKNLCRQAAEMARTNSSHTFT